MELRVAVCVLLATLTLTASTTVLDLDPTTGCVIIPTPQNGNTVTYGGNDAIQGVVTNHTNANGIDYVVPKCLVCATPITIENVPSNEHRPKFLAPCVLKAPAALDVCPSPEVGDGRLSGVETCEDGNIANGDGCDSNGALEQEAVDKRFAIALNPAESATDGYISGSELIDFSPGLHSDACSDNTVIDYQNLQCPGYDVENNGKKYMYYFIRQHGKTTTLPALNRPAVIESVTTNDFANDQRGLFKFHQSRPSVASTKETYAKTLDGQANSVTVAVQCFKNDDDSDTSNLLNTPPLQACPTGENKQILASDGNPTACKLSSVPAELDVGDYCGYQYAQTARQRVYVWSAESGNMYVDVTTLLGDIDSNPRTTNKFRYLTMLNFKAELRADDVLDINIVPSSTANTESTSSQEITFTTSQTVTFAGLEDAKFVRKLSVAATNALGYDVATAYNTISSNTESLAAVSDSGNDLYTVLLSGSQAAKAVYTVPAYRNTAEQSGLMSVQVTSVVYACDHASGSQEFPKTKTAADVHIQAVIYDLDNNDIEITPATDYTEGGKFNLNIKWSEVTADNSQTRAWKSVQCCANNIAEDKDAPTVSTQAPFTTVDAGHGCFNTTSTYWGQSDKSADQINALLATSGSGLDVTVEPCPHATQDIRYECRIEVEETNFAVSTNPYGALSGDDTSKQADVTTQANALVPQLDIGNSFDDTALVLIAGGAAQTVKVCTDIWADVKNSNCSNSEAVTLSQLEFSDMGKNAATGLHLNSQFLTVNGDVMNFGVPTIDYISDFTSVCKDYVISASKQAATCNAASINMTRNHRVSEKGIHKNVAYPIPLTIEERACPFNVDQDTPTSQVNEDGNILLANMFTIKRQSICGASESVESVTFSVSAGYSTAVKINNNDFSTGAITIAGDNTQYLATFNSLFTSGDEDTVSFIDGAVSFAQDFNTIDSPDITLFATFVSKDCGGHSTNSTQVSRTIAVKDIMDSCDKTAGYQTVVPKQGNWIHVPVEAKIENLDEYRLFKMTITSSMAIEYKLQRSGDKVDCQTNNYGEEQTCVLYCTDDGTNAGERHSSFWAPTGSGSEYICSNFQHLYVRPKFDNTLDLSVQHAIYSPDTTGCASSTTSNIELCTGFADTGTVANNYIKQPYAGTMYLKFDSEIGQSDGATQPCTLSQNYHKYTIQPATIVGEVLSTTNGKPVNYTENGDLSQTTIGVSGANLNAETVSFEFERRDHLEFEQSENGLYIALSITSQNCTDENNNALNFKLNLTETEWIYAGEGFTWLDGVKNTKAFTLKRVDDSSTANVASNCQIVVDASEYAVNSIFFPLYTTTAKITFDISANLGEIDTVDNQASVTDQALLDISYKRVKGYDGVLTVDFTASLVQCNQGDVHFSDDINADSAQLVWANGIDTTPKTIRVNFIGGPSNCQAEVVANVNGGAFIKTFIIQLSGDLGTAHINNKPMSTTSLTLLKGQGQTFTVERTAAKVAKYVVTNTDSSVSLSTQEFEWTQLDQDNGLLSKTFVVQWGNAASGTDNLELKLQLQTYSGNQWNNIGNEISYYFSVQDDKNDCTFAKIESATVVVGSSVQPVISTSYTHYVDKYVVLTEGAQHFFGDSFHDQITYTISRPANSDGAMQFKLALASFDVEDTGVFQLTPSHFVNGLTETYTMQANERSKNITLTILDDELNSGGEQLGFLYATFEALDLSTGDLSFDEKSAIITGCNANAAVSTSLSQNIRQTVTQYSSARRLLAAAVSGRGNGDANILKKEDDVTAPLTQPTTESFAARFWSSASLDKWSSALEVEMTFNVPVYEAGDADSSYGSFAQIGACPTNVTELFTKMASCTTFVPLSTSYGSTIEYVRALANLTGEPTECSNLTFPCPERWKEPLGQFQSSPTMTGIAVSSQYPDLAVFPYQYKGNLNQLQNCKLVDGVTDAVTTTASGGFTQYEFDTCIVTYGPRYAAANNSDVVLHTAKQHVVLSSSNEAVVTAIMFETNDRIRVSIEPTQKSCDESSCSNAYGPQHDCANGHYTYLELLVHVDVPYDEYNEYGFTGVYDAATIEAAATGCHWAAGVGAIYDGSVAPTISKITRYETRNGASSPSGYTYIRSTVGFVCCTLTLGC